MRFFYLSLAMFAFLLTSIGAASNPKLPPLNIYVAGSFSGMMPFLADGTLNAATIFAEKTNKSGGMVGRKVMIIPQDDAGDLSKAEAFARTAINDPNHLLTIGHPFSSIAKPIAAYYRDNHKLLFTTYATSPSLKAIKGTYFSLTFDDDYQGKVLANIAATKLSAKNVRILRCLSDTYSDSLARSFEANLRKLRVDVRLETIDYLGDKIDSEALYKSSWKNGVPDLIFLPDLQTRAADILAYFLSKNPISTTFLGGDGWGSEEKTWQKFFLAHQFKSIPKLFFTHHFSAKIPALDSSPVIKFLRKRSHGDPLDGPIILSYEGLEILKTAISSTGRADANSISAYLRGRTFPVSAGSMTFESDGSTTRDSVLLQVGNKGIIYSGSIKGAKVPHAE